MISLVKQQIINSEDGGGNIKDAIEELRFPLEEAFGMTIEEYIIDVTNTETATQTSTDETSHIIHYANADRDLAELLHKAISKE